MNEERLIKVRVVRDRNRSLLMLHLGPEREPRSY